MTALLYIIITGFLVRASGWGTDDLRFKRAAEFFSDYTCAAIFGLLSALVFSPLVGVACAVAFLLYRVPAFHGWQNWREMFWRGLWPTAIGFTLIGGFGLASIPFAALYAVIYTGGYKWLPETVLGFNRHVWIELASGWLLAIFILGVA